LRVLELAEDSFGVAGEVRQSSPLGAYDVPGAWPAHQEGDMQDLGECSERSGERPVNDEAPPPGLGRRAPGIKTGA
jgi:hypothetical protein